MINKYTIFIFWILFGLGRLWATAESDFSDLMAKAKSGNASAQARIGEAYYWGKGVAKDYNQAFTWFSTAAIQGYIPAQVSLGYLYDNGQGVDKDESKAFDWYLKAASKGDLASLVIVAKRYENGSGVIANLEDAMVWYEKAAIRGNTTAKARFGYALLTGKGVAKDEKRGFAYLLNSASTPFSRYAISWCYSKGHFVGVNLSKAYMWCLLAVDVAPQDKKYLAQLSVLKSKLSDLEISDSEKAAIGARKFLLNGEIQGPDLSVIFEGADKVVLPFKLIMGQIIISLTLNGLNDVNFLVDTGCSASGVNNKMITAVNVEKDEYMAMSGAGADIALGMITRGEVLSISKLSINKARLALFPDFDWDQILGVQLDGILGFDILKNFVIEIDYIDRNITFYNPNSFKSPQDFSAVPLVIDRNAPFLDATIAQGDIQATGRFLLDSGDNGMVTVTKVFQDSHPDFLLKRNSESGSSAFGGETTESIGQCDELKIEKIVMRNPTVSFLKNQQGAWSNLQGGWIGVGTLKRFNIIIDGPNRVLYLKPNSDFGNPDDSSIVGFGFKAIRDNYNTFVVYALIPKSPAEAAGIKEGDWILKLDKADTLKMTAADIYKIIHQDGVHHLELKRADSVIHVDLSPTMIK